MGKKLVFEIGTEELPSSCIVEGVDQLEKILCRKLEAERISFSSIDTYGTPRRLAAVLEGVSEVQKSHNRVIIGPPKKIAFDADGKPTKAAEGFAGSLKLDVSQLEEIETDRGTYMGKTIPEEGKRTIEVLPDILKESITEINFSKQMAWGNYSLKFARPIRWILALLGSQLIGFELENLKTQSYTHGLRCLAQCRLEVENAGKYMELLEGKGGVIIDPARRKKIIVDSIHKMERKLWNGEKKVLLDADLLDEVANLVEHPRVLAGSFSARYLYIPKDILIKAIEYHQKYFAVADGGGGVTTNFIIVANGPGDESGEITKGNQRVLEARLSDAAFFYEEDKKHDFSQWLEKLKGVIFYSGIGSMYDKVDRLEELVSYLAGKLHKTEIEDSLVRAARICKCDLVTNMVVEFPQLQGIVGREYALEKGEDPEVARAIFEHYLPRFAGDLLPGNDTGTILSVADKIDTICGMFLLENIPTGSEDPFALRRKAAGIVSSVLKKDYPLKLSTLIRFAVSLYEDRFGLRKPEGLEEKILDFILARYRFNLEKEGKRLDLADAIVGAGISSVSGIDKRYRALENYMGQRQAELLANPMIRCQNIIKGKEIPELEPELFTEEEERKLYEAALKLSDDIAGRIGREDYYGVLLKLEDFGKTVDLFFDRVLVMDEDPRVRANRMSLVKFARNLYFRIADFSKLVIEG
ncbi:MAG: glycine--tRNA ligase subunit beta [Actinomycetota bacterium]